jgi:hypothetical protein
VAFRAAVLITGYNVLKFGDQGAFHYHARAIECSMDDDNQDPTRTRVRVAWDVSPPQLNAD